MSLQGLAQAPVTTATTLQRRTIPYDYQFYFKIFDEKDPKKSFLDQVQSSTVTVSIEAAFVAVSVGYGLVPQVRTFTFGPADIGEASPADLSFRNILTPLVKNVCESRLLFRPPVVTTVLRSASDPLLIGPQTARVLLQGIRINPKLSDRFLQVLQDGDKMQPDELGNLFQSFEPPSDQIQFLYAFYDKGTGRAFQSEPLLNIAGLGIADGDRPFRYFATPIVIAPRSTIQLDVIPKTDFRGELYVTLHGYKVLGGAGTPTGHKLRGPAPVRRMRRP